MAASQLKLQTMTSHEILKADVLDILFDNRNKMYGAYELRKQYNKRLGIALGMMLSVVLCMVFLFAPSGEDRTAIQNPFLDNEVTVVTILPEEPVKPAEPMQQRVSAPPVRQKNFVDRIEIVSDHAATNMPDQTELSTAAISNQDVEGPAVTGQLQPHIPDNTGNGTGAQAEAESKGSFTAVEKAAEFPGGQSAWMAFLSKHLRTPDELNPGEKRTVLVRFTVSAEGSISNFEIVQSGGGIFDNEVIRVLKKMPKWKPAFQNGHHVSVIFTQPVTFMAFEE